MSKYDAGDLTEGQIKRIPFGRSFWWTDCKLRIEFHIFMNFSEHGSLLVESLYFFFSPCSLFSCVLKPFKLLHRRVYETV